MPPEAQMAVPALFAQAALTLAEMHVGQGQTGFQGGPAGRRRGLIGLGRQFVVQTRLFRPFRPAGGVFNRLRRRLPGQFRLKGVGHDSFLMALVGRSRVCVMCYNS